MAATINEAKFTTNIRDFENEAILSIQEALNATCNFAAAQDSSLRDLKKELETLRTKSAETQKECERLNEANDTLSKLNTTFEAQLQAQSSAATSRSQDPGRDQEIARLQMLSANTSLKDQEISRLTKQVSNVNNELTTCKIELDAQSKNLGSREREIKQLRQDIKKNQRYHVDTERKAQELEERNKALLIQLETWQQENLYEYEPEPSSSNPYKSPTVSNRRKKSQNEPDDIGNLSDDLGHWKTPQGPEASEIIIDNIGQIEQFCRHARVSTDLFQQFREALPDFIHRATSKENAQIFHFLVDSKFGKNNVNIQLKLAELVQVVRGLAFEEITNSWTELKVKRLLVRIFDNTEFGPLQDNKIESYLKMTEDVLTQIRNPSWFLKALGYCICSKKNINVLKVLSFVERLVRNPETSSKFRASFSKDSHSSKLFSGICSTVDSKHCSRSSRTQAKRVFILLCAFVKDQERLRDLPDFRGEKKKIMNTFNEDLQFFH